MPRFTTTVEFDYPQNHGDNQLKELFTTGLNSKGFSKLSFKEFKKISITKEEAIELLSGIDGKVDISILTDIINRIN